MTTSQPDSWWGGQGRGESRMSVLDLIRTGTLDTRTAALLWKLVEEKTSIIVASGPQRAGKTTLLSALIDLMPPSFEKVHTRGINEDFSFLSRTDAHKTYILIPELSDHTPAYLWGIRVQTLFQSLSEGYSMAATMHADSPEEVADMLGGYPVYIQPDKLHHIGVVVNLLVLHQPEGIDRRVSMVTKINPGPTFEPLAGWNEQNDSFTHLAGQDGDPEIAERTKTLEEWLAKGRLTADEVAELAESWYRNR